MILTHQQKRPNIHPTAYIAPTAAICGDVIIGAHCRIMHGAALIAESGQIVIGDYGIVFENAVLRSNAAHSLTIGKYCLIGPQAHLVGCTVEDEVFIATGAAVFHGAVLEKASEVRIHAVVHLKTRLSAGATVPIGWIAVGDPAQLFPPDQHDAIWEIQQPLNFPLTVYGLDRSEATMEKITRKLAESLSSHADDEVILPEA
ncbi:bacterial transferase hexapeptide repeat protein [Candidatus Moduliflexus flocculans]|uniref:Bacterial transferase hexapeptide repeat protein n=1 Tax=Candidatus Moduliflexus flocculans TaxID=1499966 RepID=A0A081BT55_9BACT|nr:bacterial transferase hexapeptide repeat protein [Candidatus Moduliflexus flocculans]